MILPLAASATGVSAKKNPGTTYVSPSLLQFASTHADKDTVAVIIQSADGASGAANSLHAAAKWAGDSQNAGEKKLDLVNGLSATISAKALTKLATTNGLIITPDAPVKVSANTYSNQLWPYASGNARLWGSDAPVAANMPAIAIVDSGVQARADFGTRLIASVNLSTLAGNTSLDDERGHGTFVAGIAAGAAAPYAGAAPLANLVSIKVMDSTGSGKTSDVITACQWILDHKAQYNIRVANFSLHSGIVSHFYTDPLDRAVEQLWFNGVTVVAAAGNYGTATGPSGVRYSPGNDPFAITVGAADINGTVKFSDDFIAPWSAWGHTMDGFTKPELAAPGRYMIGPVPATSTLAILRADHVVAPGYMQLSGTSFSAPVVAGTAAQIIARHPGFTPDQVKGALMLGARPMPASVGVAAGVGEVTANKSAAFSNPPNPNLALNGFVKAVTTGGVAFDSASWVDAATLNASWDSASWLDASWLDASWASASWLDASWDSASWLDSATLTASWVDTSSLDASWEDAAEADSTTDPLLLAMTPDQATALMADPLLAPDPLALPPGLLPATTTTP